MRAIIAVLVALLAVVPAAAQDTDGDGLSDSLEEQLLTDPQFAETLEVVLEDDTYEPTAQRPAHFDVTRVRFGNVARARWLWAIEFAQPYTFDNTTLILYVDADNNPETGRPGMGCETTYGHHTGRPTQMLYVPNGREQFPPPRVALEDGVLYICADLALNQQEGRSVFRMSVLSEQAQPHESRDSTGWHEVIGPGDSDRERVKTLADLETGEGFEVTQDMALLWDIHADERNAIINAFRDCEGDGYEYYHSEYRWPAMRRTGAQGTLTTTAPTAGRYHLGAVVYDSPGREVYEMSVGEEVVGTFIAEADNRRQRLFFTPQPLPFNGGEAIALRSAGDGPAIVEDIVLLAERPQKLTPPRELANLEVTWDWDRECMRATWITTWPVACTLRLGEQEIAEEEPLQNHRVYLPELEAGREYELTVNAAEAGQHAVQFVAGEPQVAQSAVARESVALTLLNDGRELPAGYPLTSGIPFPEGVLGSVDDLRLLDADGAELPLQARPLSRWRDGSIRVVLLDTALPAATRDGARLTLEYGRGVTRAEVVDPVTVTRQGEALTVSAAGLSAEFDLRDSGLFTALSRGGEPITDPGRPTRITIVDEQGNVYDTLGPPEEVTIEEAGPLRTVVRIDGHHTGDAGEFFDYQIRLTFFGRYPAVRVTYRWGNDMSGPEFRQFQAIRFELPLATEDAEVLIGADEPVPTTLTGETGLVQLRDDSYTGAAEGRRAPGWVSAGDVTLACADFWQLYPKGIGVSNSALFVDICPDFAEGEYDDCSELELYKLYYYLQNGVYKVRQGVTKVHDLWLDLGPTDGDTLGALAGEPPVVAARPRWYADSGVFGEFVPETAGRTPRYDDVCDRVYERYVSHIQSVREYGMLNFGDMWGERGANWANGEYDHHHSAAQLFMRSGHFDWHQRMRDMARHDIDVDLCHWHDTEGYTGASWTHSVGHTGSYIDERYQGEYGSPRAGQTPTHTWTEGTCEYYLLTGDPTAIEAVRMISDHYGGAYINNYDFTNGRVPGWHLILTIATYRTTGDPFYLNAARIIVDRIMERRTPGSGWARQLVPGHCHCWPRCRGACSFMQGILGVGLREYYKETADPRVEEAVPDAARYVIDEMWEDDVEMFRYTSCPESSLTASRSDTLGGLMLFAWGLSGDPLFADVAVRSMNLNLDVLSSISHVRWTPYIVYALDRLHRLQEPGFGGERGATIMLRNEGPEAFQLRVFDREGAPAPAAAASLTGPDGGPHHPSDDGRIIVESPQEGLYALHLEDGTGPWQVTCSLNRMVASLDGGLEVDVPADGCRLYLRPSANAEGRSIALEAVQGRVESRLVAPSGQVIAPDAQAMASAQAAEGGLYELELSGPGRVRLSGDGWAPWASAYRGRWFNASAPTVRIEGGTTLAPGEGRVVRLSATTEDYDGDVAGVRWILPDGREMQGERIEFEPPAGIQRMEIRAIVEDAQGNTGEDVTQVRLPHPALADAQGAITIQAEDFTGQGGGEVLVTERVASVGQIITQWHADEGHWLQWQFEVPEEGDYFIWARYATDCEEAVRSLVIDGQSPAEGYDDLRFARTGGYSTTEDNWETKRLDPPVHLIAGLHSLRMTNLGEGLALDYISLVPVR
ncbi:MAG: hypothetical protein U9R79_07070 [Armatimonadota bacterium]|nr:hypothetical protein [Armatimonadota bacterium]